METIQSIIIWKIWNQSFHTQEVWWDSQFESNRLKHTHTHIQVIPPTYKKWIFVIQMSKIYFSYTFDLYLIVCASQVLKACNFLSVESNRYGFCFLNDLIYGETSRNRDWLTAEPIIWWKSWNFWWQLLNPRSVR